MIGVRVNTIAPGLIDTPIYAVAQDPEAFKVALRRNVLFPQRLGTPAEFASLALELVTNSYLNGEVIRLDAGRAYLRNDPPGRGQKFISSSALLLLIFSQPASERPRPSVRPKLIPSAPAAARRHPVWGPITTRRGSRVRRTLPSFGAGNVAGSMP